MEILNFEMRNYFAETNTNYKAFATGGDKAQSCWMANFVPFDKVTDIYLFESAIDAMSFYEINHMRIHKHGGICHQIPNREYKPYIPI